MDKIKLDDSLKAAFGELQEYLDLQLQYNKMLLAKKMGEVLSLLTLFVLILGILGFLFIFLSFAFAEWFNEQFALPYAGHLIVAGFYLLLLVLVVLFRKPLIYHPVRKSLGNIVFGDGEVNAVFEEAFNNPGSLELQLRNHREMIKKKEVELGIHFEKLSKQLTLSNIFQTIVKNAYTSYVTTSNVVKTAYNLFKKITTRKKHKLKKKRKGRDYSEEDDD